MNTNKILAIVCILGLFAGYGAAEWIVPRYFHPTADTVVTSPQSLISVINADPDYYRQNQTGNYLAGQFAQNHKDWQTASDYISRVLKKEQDDPILQKHAMVLAMGAGEVNRAIDLAHEILKQEDSKDDLLAILFASIDAFNQENYLEAIEILDSVNKQSVAAFIVPVLNLWANTATGALTINDLDQHAFYAYHAMLAADYLNRGYEAIPYALKAFDVGEMDIRDLEKMGDMFAKLEEEEQALAIYKALQEKGYGSPEMDLKIERLSKNESITDLIDTHKIKSPKDGAALVYLNMAEILLREQSYDSAILFSRMALYLNRNLDKGRMLIGASLARFEQYDQAIDELEFVQKESPFYLDAQRQIAELYTQQDKKDKAVKILDQLYKTQNDLDSLIQIGDIYRYDENYKDAIDIYNKVLKRWNETSVPEKYWYVLYSRGMAYERLGKYEASEKDLKAALEFRPNHPFLLNYLGYSWADQNKNLNTALEMIEKAARIEPSDGYIADSLGWVYYKMGQYEEAAQYLEHAVELLPYDATINDHLGDAYWHSGRKLEARFQWRRAANYSEENEAELKAEIEEKLAHGLDEGKSSKKSTTALNTDLRIETESTTISQ